MEAQIWRWLTEGYSSSWIYGVHTLLITLSAQIIPIIIYSILDELRLPFFEKLRITPGVHASNEKKKKALMMSLKNMVVFILPSSILSPMMFGEVLGMSIDPELVPSWLHTMILLFVFLVIYDFAFYFNHRLFHEIPTLYKRFHKDHHHFNVPFALSSMAVHPVELAINSTAFMLGPMLFRPHLFVLWAWLIVIQIIGVEDHCGYKFAFSFSDLIPLAGGSEFHDWHHKYFSGNYASFFPFIDQLFNTKKSYRKKDLVSKQMPKENSTIDETKPTQLF